MEFIAQISKEWSSFFFRPRLRRNDTFYWRLVTFSGDIIWALKLSGPGTALRLHVHAWREKEKEYDSIQKSIITTISPTRSWEIRYLRSYLTSWFLLFVLLVIKTGRPRMLPAGGRCLSDIFAPKKYLLPDHHLWRSCKIALQDVSRDKYHKHPVTIKFMASAFLIFLVYPSFRTRSRKPASVSDWTGSGKPGSLHVAPILTRVGGKPR